MKVLFYGETPVIETGAARISQKLLSLMRDLNFEVEVVGINHFGDVPYDKDVYPFQFYDAPAEEWYNLTNAHARIKAGGYDLLFMTGDMQHLDDIMGPALEARDRWDFPIVSLAVVDCDFDMPYLATFAKVDYPFVYSQYGYEVISRRCPAIKDKLRVITLGCEPESFYPLPAEQRQEIRTRAFHTPDPSTFLVTCVNRNQRRKDLGRTMYAFHLFHQQYPNSTLYMHAKMHDLGGHLPSQAHLLGLETGGEQPEVIFAPPEYSVVQGFQRNVLNEVYNAADVCISTSQGEGWGLTTTESMCAGTPFIGPCHTTFPEILGRENDFTYDATRGYLVECGGPDLWMIHYGLGEEPRELTSVTGMFYALEHVYLFRSSAKNKAITGRNWCLEHTWQHMIDEWKGVLCQIKSELPSSRV